MVVHYGTTRSQSTGLPPALFVTYYCYYASLLGTVYFNKIYLILFTCLCFFVACVSNDVFTDCQKLKRSGLQMRFQQYIQNALVYDKHSMRVPLHHAFLFDIPLKKEVSYNAA